MVMNKRIVFLLAVVLAVVLLAGESPAVDCSLQPYLCCFGVSIDDDRVCSSHGYCEGGTDICVCEKEWAGQRCQTRICSSAYPVKLGFVAGISYDDSGVGLRFTDDSPCSSHGTCDNNGCNCNPGWIGYACEFPANGMLTPAALDFSSVTVGTSGPVRTVTFTNTSIVDMDLGAITVTGPSSGDFILGGSCPGVSPSMVPTPPTKVRFSYVSYIGGYGTLFDAPLSDGGSPITGYTATAHPGGQMFTVFPSSNFEGVVPLPLPNQTFTVTATNAFGTSAPGPWQPGTVCTITITFTPQATGPRSATLNVDANVINQFDTVRSTLSVPLSGSGTISARSIVIDALTPTTLYAGLDGAGIYKSTNSGASWTPATPPTNKRVKALVIKPGDSTKLYAATYGGGVYKSINSGDTWDVCANTNLTNLNLVTLSIDANGKLYAGTEAGVFVSADDCVNWTAMSNGFPN